MSDKPWIDYKQEPEHGPPQGVFECPICYIVQVWDIGVSPKCPACKGQMFPAFTFEHGTGSVELDGLLRNLEF